MRAPLDPPALTEWMLLRLLPPGVVSASVVGDLREEYARRRRQGEGTWWYRREAWGIVWRGMRDRVRGHGPFTTDVTGQAARRARESMIPRLVRGLRYAWRGLTRAPQFTIAAVVTLALAIGANASIFSVVQGVLLRPLRFQDSDRLVSLHHSAPGLGYDRFGVSPGIFLLYQAEADVFARSGLYASTTSNVTGDEGPPDRLDAAVMTPTAFTTLGISPALGRVFDGAEASPGGELVVVLSHALWRDRFGGDPAVLGRTLRVDGEPRTIVGVMPAAFEFPSRNTRLWLPLGLDSSSVTQYGNFSFDAVARLKEGDDAVRAQARLRPVLDRLRDANIEGGQFKAFMDAGRLAPVVVPLKERVVGDVSRALWILLGTVGFVFLIACANVANLFLVRAEARQKEMAVRAAMGAGRGGLIGHYLSEALVIAGLGGVLGLGLTWVGLRTLLRVAPPNLPRLHEVSIDPGVVAFTLSVTAVAAVLLGILPTLRLTAPDLLATLSRSGRGSTAGRERNRARQALVVLQTALALVLLVGSGLMVRSFQNLRALNPGFDPSNTLTFRLSLPSATYGDSASVAAFHDRLLDRLRGLPGVQTVGATSHAPLAGCCSGTAHDIADHPTQEGQLPPMFWYSTVTPGYFEAMRIPLLAGRTFDSRDRDPAARTAVISQAVAQRFWQDASGALGKRLRVASDTANWYTVVGVVGNVRDKDLQVDPADMIYYPVAANVVDFQSRNLTYVIRAAQPEALAQVARREVWAADPNLPIAATQTYERIVAESMVRLSFTMLALVVASGIALVLGAVGLYGVISYLVTQRSNEIGIRLALGARPAQVLNMVVMQGVRLTALGLIIGFAGAIGLTRFLRGMLFGTEPTDPLTFGAVLLFLSGIALFASWLPAHRAARIDPASSLKAE